MSTVNSPDIQTNDSPVTTPECNEKVAKEDDKSSSECHQPKQITTKLRKNIARILGETNDVLLLDRARNDLQLHPKSTFHQDKYKNLLTQMQTKVLAEHASLKKEHNNWEKEVCLNHDFRVPNFNDLKEDGRQYSIYKKILLCKGRSKTLEDNSSFVDKVYRAKIWGFNNGWVQGKFKGCDHNFAIFCTGVLHLKRKLK